MTIIKSVIYVYILNSEFLEVNGVIIFKSGPMYLFFEERGKDI